MSQSFNDIRTAVTAALTSEDKDKGADLAVTDLGPDWVVYSDPDTIGGGLFKRGFKIDPDGKVTFTSDPVKVAKQTAYNEIGKDEPTTMKEANVRVKEHFRRRRAEARSQQATASNQKETS